MPRKPRFNIVGLPQYVIQRGNNREPCFFSEHDYRCYLEALEDVVVKYDCRIHAYVLMTNHVHMLITPMVDHGISQMMWGGDMSIMSIKLMVEVVRYGKGDINPALSIATTSGQPARPKLKKRKLFIRSGISC